MALTEKDLLKKKKEIEEAKDEMNSLKGQKKVYEEQLKKDWDCKSLQDAKKKLTEFQTKSQELGVEIEEGLEELEEKYFNDDE